MSELTGVPSLSTAHRQVLLRGRGRCKTIKDLHTVEEGVRKKKRKWGLMSDTEDDSDDSSEEFVEIVPKLAKRSTPRSKAAVLTPRMKRMKVVERRRESPDSDLSPVPPVRRVSVGDQDDHQQGRKCSKLSFLECKTVDKVKNNYVIEITEDSDVIKEVSRSDIIKDIRNDEQSKEVKDPVDIAAKPCVGGVCLPPGYGADKLAMVLMRLLEEKIKVSTSHSERELFRKTIHVLVCGGCKDREKHNKVRCRRCEERDKRKTKTEDKRKNDKGKVKDKQIIVDNRKVEEKNGKIINKNTFATTTKESPTNLIVNNNSKGPVKKDAVVPKPLKARIEDKSKMTDCRTEPKSSPIKSTVGICCEKCGQKFKQVDDLKEHRELVDGQGCKVTRSEIIFSNQTCLDLQTDEQKSGGGGQSLENKDYDSVDTSMCDTIEGKGTLKEGLDEDLGMIDRDRIFSDLDDPVEDPSFGDDLVLDIVRDTAHVELIHEDEIDTELAIDGGEQGGGVGGRE